MSGTIPEHDWTGKIQLEREHIEQQTRERMRDETRREVTGLWFKVAGVLITTVVIGGFVEWGRWQALESEYNQRIEASEREIARLEQRVEGIQGLRTDLAALGARFDAWRTSESAADTHYRRQIDQQLEAIRVAVEPRHRP